MDKPQHYTPLAIALHWLIAALMIGLFVLGLYMSDLPRTPERITLYGLHKSFGVTVYLLACVRLFWRWRNPAPELPETMTPILQQLAHIGHRVLYLLMFIIPLTGWLMSSAKGYQTVYFGLLPIPDLLAKDEGLGDFFKEAHELLNFLMAAIVAGHIGFAIKHHRFDKDEVLKRMAPWIKEKQ